MPDANKDSPKTINTKPMSIGILLVIGCATLATIGVGYYLIESLNDNSKKMKLYAVKPNHGLAPIIELATENEGVPDITKRHPLSEATRARAESAASKKDFKTAIELYKLSLEQFKRDEIENKRQDIQRQWAIGWRLHSIAICYYMMHDYKRALTFENEAIKIEDTAGYRDGRAKVYDALGEKALASKDRQHFQSLNSEEKEIRQDVEKHLVKDIQNMMLDTGK